MQPAGTMRILQISGADLGGGAERVAWELQRAYRARGHDARLAVGHKLTADPHVLPLPNAATRNPWSRLWWSLHAYLARRDPARYPRTRLSRAVRALAAPAGVLDYLRGVENFHFPGAWHLLESQPHPPDLIHAHNLHHNYFDLRALPYLSRQAPLVLTLHDAWLLSGHCAHSLGCERWRSGCGSCPDLSLYPAVRRDATAFNWQRKQAIYHASRLYVATPSRWLMDKVEQSMLRSGIVQARVVPNGVDLAIFQPGDRAQARRDLGLPDAARLVLFAANGIRANPWKDFAALRAAIACVADQPVGADLHFIALGEDAPPEQIGAARIRFIPFQADPTIVAAYYRAADLYIHAARADTFPNTVLEALACGTPVVATAVGGIPEQVIPLDHAADPTGILVPPGDATAIAAAIERLLTDAPLRAILAHNAATDAARRFGLERQVETYLAWYREILDARAPVPTAAERRHA